jgi:hypothetical protein
MVVKHHLVYLLPGSAALIAQPRKRPVSGKPAADLLKAA